MKRLIYYISAVIGMGVLVACGASPNKTETPPAVYTTTQTTQAVVSSAVSVFSDGGYQVGPQVLPGDYRPSKNIQDLGPTMNICSWTIYQNDKQKDDEILDINFKETGRPQITLKKGNYIETDGCGDWARVK